MNPYSGDVYRLGADVASSNAIGDRLELAELRRAERKRELTDDERRAVAALERREPVIRVSEQAAQRSLLGGRELERRQRRRVQAKASRKANRS